MCDMSFSSKAMWCISMLSPLMKLTVLVISIASA